MPNPKILTEPPEGARKWFDHHIPVTMGVDNLLFRTGKLLIESYYNGYLSAMEEYENHIAFYEWEDVDTDAKTIKLTVHLARVNPEMKSLKDGDMVGRSEVTHVLPHRNAKKKAKSVAGADEPDKEEAFVSETLWGLDSLRREYIPGKVSTKGYIVAEDQAPVNPPPPKSPPPPTL